MRDIGRYDCLDCSDNVGVNNPPSSITLCRSCYSKRKRKFGRDKYIFYKDNGVWCLKKHQIDLYERYRSSAIRRGIEFNLSGSEFMKLWGLPCSYCGASIKTIGIDRVDSDIGYNPENIVSCCGCCNLMKRSMSKDDFINKCKAIAHKHQ